MSYQHKKQLETDIKQGVEKAMRENVEMSAFEAMQQVTKEMLLNNPFVPPKGCPINDLPNELLAHIFYVGMVMEEESYDSDEEDEDELGLDDEWEDEEDEEDGIGPSSKGKKDTGKIKKADEKEVDEKEVKSQEENEEDEEEKRLPFQVLVSHVCRHWREVAINTPNLWTTVAFAIGIPLDQPRVWIERSKGHPLDIIIDCTSPDEEDADDIDDALFLVNSDGDVAPGSSITAAATAVTENASRNHEQSQAKHMTNEDITRILDVIVPDVDRWRTLEVTANVYEGIYTILERLSQCPAAPLLEMLQMYHYEECEEYETFSPPELGTRFLLFNGNAPRLKDLALWGVHIDWDNSLSYLCGLRDLELAYHAHDVRPSFETFASMIHASPELHTLSLCLSGPAGTKEDWGTSQIEIPSLKELVLCHHEPQYIESLLPHFVIPNLVNLALEFDSADYTDFARMLSTPLPGRTKSILAGLEALKIAGLPSTRKAREQMMDQLVNLHSINLNCSGDEEEFFDKLMEVKPTPSGTGQMVVYCPNLKNIATTGIDGKQMKRFVDVRKTAGAPITRVSMSEEDDVDQRELKWLREHLEELEFFEPSDSEEEIVDVDFSDVEMDDDDD
ncbi:hypothetical protein VKT23_003669 [Stygiomarasmius scandens]|uniref:F-box domain-containing protein n=1 Tax=Marasmiellus scandens TaxID=2682957 RepID=A0ABR1JZM0_9AGAR